MCNIRRYFEFIRNVFSILGCVNSPSFSLFVCFAIVFGRHKHTQFILSSSSTREKYLFSLNLPKVSRIYVVSLVDFFVRHRRHVCVYGMIQNLPLLLSLNLWITSFIIYSVITIIIIIRQMQGRFINNLWNGRTNFFCTKKND